MGRRLRASTVAAAVLLASCSPELRPPYDLSVTGYAITQTFGQLIMFDGTLRPAHFVVISVPTGEQLRTPATGVMRYYPDFEGLGPTLVLTPKAYLSSDTNFDEVEGMPKPGAIRFAFSNLIEDKVREAAADRFDVIEVDGHTAAADRFIQQHPDNRDLPVEVSTTFANSTIIGAAADGEVSGQPELRIMAFTGEPGAIREFINPLPFLLAGIPSTSRDAIDSQPPTIGEVAFYAADNDGMLGANEYVVPSSDTLLPPNALFGHIAIAARVDDTVSAAGLNLGIYEFSYTINSITRATDGTVATRTPVSNGRHLANRMAATDPPTYLALYHAPRSSAGTRSFTYNLHFDPTSPPDDPPAVRNYTSESNAESLDVSGLAAGEYEFVFKARDARMNPGPARISG